MRSYSMNFIFNISCLFSWWVFPFSNCYEIKVYLADCPLFRENSPPEHSLDTYRKFEQITSGLLFTCGTTVPKLTGNMNLSQLHIRGNLTCLILVKKLYYYAGHDASCCHGGSKRKLIRYQLLSNLLFV